MKPSLWILVLAVGVLAIGCTALLWSAPALAVAAGDVGTSLDPATVRWAYASAALATAASAMAAAYAVAKVGSAAVGALAENPELFGRIVVLVGLAEGIAIYGLIVSILILNQLG